MNIVSKKLLLALLLVIILASQAYSQIELVPVSHKVYPFLKRMELKGLIQNYNSANLPLSRKDVATFLNEISDKTSELSSAEKKMY